MIQGEKFVCTERTCGLLFFRPRNTPKIVGGPPTCACGREMASAGTFVL